MRVRVSKSNCLDPARSSRRTRFGEAGRTTAAARVSSRSYRSRRIDRRKRRAAAVVEFAIVSPLLVLLVFGIIECGRVVMVQQILTNASREGARRAILEQSSVSEVEEVVADYLADSSVAGAQVTVSPDPLTSVGFGDPVTVTCAIPFNQVSWLPAPWFMGGKNLTAQSTMNGERPE